MWPHLTNWFFLLMIWCSSVCSCGSSGFRGGKSACKPQSPLSSTLAKLTGSLSYWLTWFPRKKVIKSEWKTLTLSFLQFITFPSRIGGVGGWGVWRTKALHWERRKGLPDLLWGKGSRTASSELTKQIQCCGLLPLILWVVRERGDTTDKSKSTWQQRFAVLICLLCPRHETILRAGACSAWKFSSSMKKKKKKTTHWEIN